MLIGTDRQLVGNFWLPSRVRGFAVNMNVWRPLSADQLPIRRVIGTDRQLVGNFWLQAACVILL